MMLESICRSVVNVAKLAGEFAFSELDELSKVHVRNKTNDRDMFTHVDQACERRIVAGLQKILPEATFITEEKTIDNVHGEMTWIIDPLDGTTNYVHHIPFFSVSIALMMHNRIVLGVVFNPSLDECFHGFEGGGAFLNDIPIGVSDTGSLAQALIATGFPYEEMPNAEQYLELLKVFTTHSHGVRRFGSAAIDLAWVACGRFDAFYEVGLNAWDVAAGAFLVEQAGGLVSDFSGGQDHVFGKQIIATNRALYPRFFDLTNSYLASGSLKAEKKD